MKSTFFKKNCLKRRAENSTIFSSFLVDLQFSARLLVLINDRFTVEIVLK